MHEVDGKSTTTPCDASPTASRASSCAKKIIFYLCLCLLAIGLISSLFVLVIRLIESGQWSRKKAHFSAPLVGKPLPATPLLSTTQPVQSAIPSQAPDHSQAVPWLTAYWLVQIAEESLQQTQAIGQAKQALQTAIDWLSNDPAAHPIREAIGSQLAILNTLSPIDITPIYLRLSALEHQLADSLPVPSMNTIAAPSEKNSHVFPKDDEASGWDRLVIMLKRALSQLVTIYYVPNNVEGIGPIDKRKWMYPILLAELSNAKWALLHQQTVIYQTSLRQAASLIEANALLDTQAKAFLTEIAALKKVAITLVLPPTLQLSAIKQLLIDHCTGKSLNNTKEGVYTQSVSRDGATLTPDEPRSVQQTST